MEISHPLANWTLQYEEGRGTGPQKLQLDGKTLFSFMHSRIDGISDDALETQRAHHFHKSGLAVFEGNGVFSQGTHATLRQNHQIGGNAVRLIYDLTWPDACLAKGLELGSVVLSPSFTRFFVVAPDTATPEWRDLPAAGEPAISLSPIPAAIVLETASGIRFEYGLGGDLWRWAKALNGTWLHATGRLELSRTTGGRVSLRRWVAECDPVLEEKLAAAENARRQNAAEQLRKANNLPEDDKPLDPCPASHPDPRVYRFTAYFAWSQPELVATLPPDVHPQTVKLNQQGEINRADLVALGPSPALRLDMATLPVNDNARRTDGLCCWQSNQAQNLFRRLIRQLAGYSPSGTLVLDNLAPGWCDVGSHENRKHNAHHWDLNALLDQCRWSRQILGPQWTFLAPQSGLWAELPSLACLGAENGFRVKS